MDTDTDRREVREMLEPIEAKKTDGSERRALQTKKRISWREMSPARKIASTILVAAELVLTGWASWDLKHRPAADINGKKRTWIMLFLIQPFGPIGYLVFGRK